MIKPILYEIPASFFPGWKVVKPFHAKVKYEFEAGKVTIDDVCFSALCLQYIDTRGLIERMKKDIAEAERKKVISNVHPIISSAIAPHI